MQTRTDDKAFSKENTKIRLYNYINCVSDRFREKNHTDLSTGLKFEKSKQLN